MAPNMKYAIIGLIAGLAISACATPIFGYKFYVLDANSYEGFLRGPKPENDLSLLDCRPTDRKKHPCMVVKTEDYLTLVNDYLGTKIDLEKCEQGR